MKNKQLILFFFIVYYFEKTFQIYIDKKYNDCFLIDDCDKYENITTTCKFNKCINELTEPFNFCRKIYDIESCREYCKGIVEETIYYNNKTKCCNCGNITYKYFVKPNIDECKNKCLKYNSEFIISKNNICNCLNAKIYTRELCADKFKCQKYCENLTNIDVIGTCENSQCACRRTIFSKPLILCDNNDCKNQARKKNLTNGICDQNKYSCIFSKASINEYGDYVCEKEKCLKLVDQYRFLKKWRGVCNWETNMCDWVPNYPKHTLEF